MQIERESDMTELTVAFQNFVKVIVALRVYITIIDIQH